MRLIDADKLEAELRKTKFLDENDKVIVCAVIENAPREGYEEFEVKPTWEQVKEYCRKRDLVLLTYELFAWLKATAKPRRHGHWEVWFENEETRQVKCSECRMLFTVGKGRDGNYCPNCGAKMLEVEDDETD